MLDKVLPVIKEALTFLGGKIDRVVTSIEALSKKEGKDFPTTLKVEITNPPKAIKPPEVQRVSLEGIEAVTIQGKEGPQGPQGADGESIRGERGEKGDSGRNPLTVSRKKPTNPQIGDLWYQP